MPRARQAICHAFDHESYIRDVTLGTADKPRSVFPSIMDGMPDEDLLLPYDPARARDLLAEAGIAPGTELTLAYYTGFGDVEGQVLQAWLAEIGLTLRLQERSFSAFLDEFFGDAGPGERADMFYFSWWPNVDHPYSFAWSLFSADAVSADGNSGRYANDEATALIDGMLNRLVDDEVRGEVRRLRLHRLQRVAREYLHGRVGRRGRRREGARVAQEKVELAKDAAVGVAHETPPEVRVGRVV